MMNYSPNITYMYLPCKPEDREPDPPLDVREYPYSIRSTNEHSVVPLDKFRSPPFGHFFPSAIIAAWNLLYYLQSYNPSQMYYPSNVHFFLTIFFFFFFWISHAIHTLLRNNVLVAS